MSEGRISGVQSDEPSPRLQPASDFARLDWSIPEKHDINPQAMGFIRQTIAARREFDMTATGRYAQAAMNADPKSVTVQKLYGMVQADLSKHADTDAYVEQSISALRAGRTEDSVAWAQKAYDRNPTDDTYGMLQSARLKSAEVAAKRAAEQTAKAPKGTSPILPLLAIFGTGLAAYGGYRVTRSKSAWSEQEFDRPQEEERDSERIQQNRHRLKIAAAAVAVSVAVVYGGGWLIRVGGPAVLTMLRGGNTSLQRTLASETGALNPAEAQALKEAATIGSARLIPGFTAVESQVINEAQQIISSPQFSRLQEVFKAGRPVTVNIGGRLIQYEPDMPTSGMSFFEGGGFYIGREAFKSPAELQKTVLHELYRLATTQSSNGVTGKLASTEASAAYTFADRAAGALRR